MLSRNFEMVWISFHSRCSCIVSDNKNKQNWETKTKKDPFSETWCHQEHNKDRQTDTKNPSMSLLFFFFFYNVNSTVCLMNRTFPVNDNCAIITASLSSSLFKCPFIFIAVSKNISVQIIGNEAQFSRLKKPTNGHKSIHLNYCILN